MGLKKATAKHRKKSRTEPDISVGDKTIREPYNKGSCRGNARVSERRRAKVILSGSLKRNVVMLAATFLICSFLNVLFEGFGFTECSRLYCGVLVLLWALSIQARVTHARLRNLLLWIAALILLCSLLQIFRNQFFRDIPAIQRYLWYLHYAPMMAIALLCFYLSVCIYQPAETPLPAVFCLPGLAGVLLTLGVLTNDVHFFAFRFSDDGESTRAWLMYCFMAFLLVTVFTAYFVILKKHRRYNTRKHCLLPLLPLAVEILYIALYVLDSDPRIGGVRVWDYGEIFCICTVAFLETCIQTGMIPANKDYDKLFSASSYPAVILNRAGTVIYQTAGAKYPFRTSEDIQVKRHFISGGRIEWTVDVKYTHALSRQLTEATQQLKTRNAYLAEENRIKREKAEMETRNRLYDGISEIIRTQLSEIDAMLNDTETPIAAKLPKISVWKAYIKRRSNMELLAISGPLPVGELTAAITETLDYVKLCGVVTAASSSGTGAFPSDLVIAAYEQFWNVLHKSIDSLSHMHVSVRAEKSELTLRMLLKTEDFSCEADSLRQAGRTFSSKGSITKEGPDIRVSFTFVKGGGA